MHFKFTMEYPQSITISDFKKDTKGDARKQKDSRMPLVGSSADLMQPGKKS